MISSRKTDATTYQVPYTTISLIVVNTVVFLLSILADPDQVAPWRLRLGNGLHPLQWLTHSFVHEGFLHLLGNMLFLFGFGLVVEMKLGWWRMLLVYLLAASAFGALTQTVMLNSNGSLFGTSGVLFALMIITLIWSPRNEMDSFSWMPLSTRVDLSMILWATAFVIWQLIWIWINDFGKSSTLGHLLGMVVGAVTGVALLRLEIVDCQGWDLLSVVKGIKRKPVSLESQAAKPTERASPPKPKPKPCSPEFRRFVLDVTNRLLGGDAPGAAKFYSMHRKSHPEWTMDEPDLMALIRVLHEQKQWSDSLRPMNDYLRQFPERSARMRLKLAHILINTEHRPSQAIEVLAKLPQKTLSADLQTTRDKLLARAEAMKPECGIEVADGDEW